MKMLSASTLNHAGRGERLLEPLALETLLQRLRRGDPGERPPHLTYMPALLLPTSSHLSGRALRGPAPRCATWR